MDTKKASIPNTAIEELPEFVFNEAGDGTVALPLTGQEGLQMAGDDYIHGIVFRISGPVLGIDGHEGIAASATWDFGLNSPRHRIFALNPPRAQPCATRKVT